MLFRSGVGGSAVNGFDYPPLLGTVTFPSGVDTVKIPLSPNPDVQTEGTDTVVLTLAAGTGYLIGAQNTATVTISDSPATLYVASVRPTTNAVGGSTASGTASILLSASGTLAAVNVTFSNLSSAEVTAHLTIGANEDYVFNLPIGQVTGEQWRFIPTGNYGSAGYGAQSGSQSNSFGGGNAPMAMDTSQVAEPSFTEDDIPF